MVAHPEGLGWLYRPRDPVVEMAHRSKAPRQVDVGHSEVPLRRQRQAAPGGDAHCGETYSEHAAGGADEGASTAHHLAQAAPSMAGSPSGTRGPSRPGRLPGDNNVRFTVVHHDGEVSHVPRQPPRVLMDTTLRGSATQWSADGQLAA